MREPREQITGVTVDVVSDDESWRVFDLTAHRLLGMSGAVFKDCWRQGKFADDASPAVTHVALLMPGAW